MARRLVLVMLTVSVTRLWSQEPARQELIEKIDALQARIEQLEAAAERDRANTRTPPTARDVDVTVLAVQRDAEARGRALLPGDTRLGGWDDGFRIRSADGRSVLHPWLQLQLRGVVDHRQRGGDDGDRPDTQSGFEIRRCYFAVDGTAVSPDLSYLVVWAANRHNGAFDLLAGWAAYHFPGTPLTVKAGQFANPFDHESLTLSRFQLAADRSLTADLLAGGDDYVQGVQVEFVPASDDLRLTAAVTDGFANANKDFRDFPAGKADFGLAGRAEWKLRGDWKDYRDFTALGDKRDLCVIGAAVDWTQAGRTDAVRHVVDIQYETPWGGGLYAAYLGRYMTGTAATGADAYDASVRVQGSYLLNLKREVFVRYEYIRLDPRELPTGARGNLQAITAGLNYYVESHRAKFTIDLTYLPNGSPLSDDGAGVLGTGAATTTSGIRKGGGNELVARLQFQLYL